MTRKAAARKKRVTPKQLVAAFDRFRLTCEQALGDLMLSDAEVERLRSRIKELEKDIEETIVTVEYKGNWK